MMLKRTKLHWILPVEVHYIITSIAPPTLLRGASRIPFYTSLWDRGWRSLHRSVLGKNGSALHESNSHTRAGQQVARIADPKLSEMKWGESAVVGSVDIGIVDTKQLDDAGETEPNGVVQRRLASMIAELETCSHVEEPG